ncbi:probable leucine-rich repeat receptor-like protein kinase [Tanacetum coccineum]
MEMMNLSHNKLSGSIPNGFSNLPRGIHIDLSYNELRGPVPVYAAFLNVSGEALQGNDCLCGNVTGEEGGKFFSITSFDGQAMYDEIIKATNDFDDAYCIGMGGYGTVYKALSYNPTI